MSGGGALADAAPDADRAGLTPHTLGDARSGTARAGTPWTSTAWSNSDEAWMDVALDAAAAVRLQTPPNPWVGCVLVWPDGRHVVGATQPPGGPHAEADALAVARRQGWDPRGTTAYVTLEPCSHTGRTPPCADALIEVGVARVVVALTDPDPRVGGRGLARLGAAGIRVDHGARTAEAAEQLAPYLHHRRTGRPYVVLKLAATLDGATAMADGSSQWITGDEARVDAHRLRAESQAIMVGAGTVRADDPSLTVRLVDGPDPLRLVMGHAPAGAQVHPCWERQGDVGAVLDELGGAGVLQLMVEGGASLAHDLHRAGLVDRYVLYLAPALAGGDDHRGLMVGPGAPTMAALWRGRIVATRHLGPDLRIDLVPPPASLPSAGPPPAGPPPAGPASGDGAQTTPTVPSQEA